jgi:MYXO-CTERM domain-containing protein
VSCGGAAERLPDGGTKIISTGCDPAGPPMYQCQAPSYGGGYYGVPEAAGLSGTGTSSAPVGSNGSGPTGTTGGTSVDKGGTPPSAGAPSGSSSQGTTGSAGAANGADQSSASGNGNGSASSDSGGCQMSAGQADATGASILGLLGVAGLMRRRKRTRWG